MLLQKDTLMQEFKKYDKDGQGSVSASDFKKILKAHGLGRATNSIVQNYREGGGRVDYNQFIKQCYQTNE
jgi:Ca2+-binding EF-hand superfamily protein